MSNGQIELSTSQSAFVIRVESMGQKKPREILSEASEIIKEKATEFQSELSKLKK
jgi:DNA-directed RNA polymerase alpha subunit